VNIVHDSDSVINMQASAILTLLAASPNGWATLTGLEQHLQAHAAASPHEDLVTDQLLDGIDLIEAGLVVADGEELQITDAGHEVANIIRQYRDRLPLTAEAPGAEALGLIDRLVGPDVRSRIFDLELRGTEKDLAEGSGEEGKDQQRPPPTESLIPAQRFLPIVALETRDQADSPGPEPIEHPPQVRPDPRATARRASSGDTGHTAPRERAARTPVGTAVLGKLRYLGLLWRRHLERDLPKARPASRPANHNGAMVALISFLALIICVGAVVALTQIRSLKMEISSLQRELSPLKERLSHLDQAEKGKEAKDAKARDESDRRPAALPQQAPLSLSREEVQLIRDYIKPAPASGPSTASVSVGDPVVWPTIPFPSPVTEKVPKLLGARFTIRNGAILIVRRDSRQIDAVLGPS
jgi:hypothetical protein